LKPNRLTVRKGDEVLEQVTLLPDWAPVQITSPGPARLSLEADDCVEDPEVKRREWDCHSFQVRGVHFTRIELYDVAKDPGQTRDVSREQSRSTRTLLRDLMAFKPTPAGKVSTPPLDPELEESLRALGYIK
jgi:hypothetical protein